MLRGACVPHRPFSERFSGTYQEESVEKWEKSRRGQMEEVAQKNVIVFDTTAISTLCSRWRTAERSHYGDSPPVGGTYIHPGSGSSKIPKMGARNTGWSRLWCNYLAHTQLAVQYLHGLDPGTVQLACDFRAPLLPSSTKVPRSIGLSEEPVDPFRRSALKTDRRPQAWYQVDMLQAATT